MDDGGSGKRYVAGDVIRMELALEHSTNLARVFVAFSHERDPLTEFYFETTSFPTAEVGAAGVRRSRVLLESPVPPETIPGVYSLTHVNAFSVGGKLSRGCGRRHSEPSSGQASRSSRSPRRRRPWRGSTSLPDPYRPIRTSREAQRCRTL